MQPIIGIDNGATGSIGIITDDTVLFAPIPTQPYLHYGKKGTLSHRLDRTALKALLKPFQGNGRVFIERPFTGLPKMFHAVVSAHRFFEATLCTLEDLQLGHEVVDSQSWQKPVLGAVKGSQALKLASRLRGIQLYPQFSALIAKHKDADGLLIAHRYFYHAQAHPIAA